MITPAYGLTATERVLPNLALDFTTASLDPRITFTRAGNTATAVNSSGNIVLVNENIPRFDYNPTTLVCKGLLIEEARTNSLQNSIVQGAVVGTPGTMPINWQSYGSSGGLTQTVVGTGTENGINYVDVKYAGTTVNSGSNVTFARFGANNAVSATSGQSWTSSFYVKLVEGSTANLISVANSIIEFSAGGSALAGNRTTFTPSLTLTRVSHTRTLGNASTAFVVSTCEFSFAIGANIDITLRIGFPQLELGAFATSYIPTEASQVTRTADVATMTGANFSDWYSAGAGGVVARVLPSTVSGTRPALQFDNASADEVIALRGNTTNPELVVVDDGAPQAQIDAGTIAANTAYNLGAAWDTDNCAAAVNGGAAVTDTTATIPTVTQARLGSDGTNYLNGHLQTVRYWPQRIINAEVQAFSK